MKRLVFLLTVTVPLFAGLGGCGSGGDTQPAGESGGSGGSSNAGGSKSGGSGSSGTSNAGSGGSKSGGAGSGAGGSSGGASSGSGCALGCQKMAELNCPNDSPATCPADCAARLQDSADQYPDCVEEDGALIDCFGAAPISEWQCNAMGKAGVSPGNCTAETNALAECIIGTGG